MYKHATLSRTLVVGCIMLLIHALATAADWPRFRGPNGTGTANDEGIPTKWTEKDGIAWKTAIPGAGNSSPIIFGNRLFLETSLGDGGERQMICVNTADGKILWATPVQGGKAKKHQKNSFASSTPATDGERVYGVFWDGQNASMIAFDFSGKIVWKRDFGKFTSQHGVGASPVVFEDKVYLNNDQDETAALIALNAKTGDVAWEAPRKPFRACYSTPFILTNDSKPELIVASTAGITSYNPHDGKVNWDWVWDHSGSKPLRTVASPVLANDLIVASSGDGDGSRQLVAIRVVRSKPELAWQLDKQTPYVPTTIVANDLLFLVNDDGTVSCLRAKTGETVWAARLGAGNVTASPILIGNNIYAINEEGVVFVYKAGEKFELLAKNPIGEQVMATPAVANGRLYIRGRTHLYCIGDNHAASSK